MDNPLPDFLPWLSPSYHFHHDLQLHPSNLPLPPPSPSLSVCRHRMYNPNIESWLHVKLLYVRVISSCPQLPADAPDSLLIVCPPRDITTELEVNGGRIPPSEKSCITLRKDRVDPEASEATYVSTKSLRVAGYRLSFEIYEKDELLAYGELARTGSYYQDSACFDSAGAEGDDMLLRSCTRLQQVSNMGGKSGLPNVSSMSNSWNGTGCSWSLDCACGNFTMGGSFRNNNNANSNSSFSSFLCNGKVPSTMEVYVAGMCSGHPLVLTATLQLSCVRRRRRNCARLCSNLDAIPEAEEYFHPFSSQKIEPVSQAVATDGLYRAHNVDASHFSVTSGLPNDFLFTGFGNEYSGIGDEDELSWFNAGVRVGVGIGLGLCLGLGIGLSLLIRPFRRKLF